MKKSDIFDLILKTFGIFLFYRFIDFTVNIYIFLTDGFAMDDNYIPSYFLYAVVLLFLSIVFVFKSSLLTNWILKKEEMEDAVSFITDKKSMIQIASIIIGGYLLINSIMDILHFAITDLYNVNSSYRGAYAIVYSKYISAILKLVISWFLVFKAGFISNYYMDKLDIRSKEEKEE